MVKVMSSLVDSARYLSEPTAAWYFLVACVSSVGASNVSSMSDFGGSGVGLGLDSVIFVCYIRALIGAG